LIPFGGTLEAVSLNPGGEVLLTFLPEVPMTPPESMWMRTARTDIAGLVVNKELGGRVVYLPADVDRRYAIDNFPDHGELLANIVRWVAKDRIPLEVRGTGLIDCELYRQEGRIILHVVNLTSAGTWRAPVDELIAVGPFQVRVRIPDGIAPKSFRKLVAGEGRATPIAAESGWVQLEIDSVPDHEVIVIES